MTIYYVDSSFTGGSNKSGLSADAPLTSLEAVNKLKLQAGDTVAFKAGTAYTASAAGTGALTISGSGTEKAPITFTTYGTGPAPTITNTATGYSDGILVGNAKYVVIDGLNITGAGQAGVNVSKSASHITIQNVEASNVGEGVMLVGTDNLVTRSYFHDLKMIKNTANVYDDDYGAVGVMIANSNNEVSYTKIVNAKAPSFDYKTDGGGIELFGSMNNIKIHNNWVENSVGFLEAGGPKSTLTNISISNNVSLNNTGFLVLHNGGGNFGSTFKNVDASNNTIIDQNNGAKQMASVFLDAPYQKGELSFHDNVMYMNNGDSFFKQVGDYHYNNTFYAPSKATHLYNNWNMTLNSGEKYVTTAPTGSASIVETLKAVSGGIGASLVSADSVGLNAAKPALIVDPAPIVDPVPDVAIAPVVPALAVPAPTPPTSPPTDNGDKITKIYDAAGVLISKTVVHADKSSDVYLSGITGRDYVSTHTSTDSTGKVVLLEQFRADGSLVMKKVVGIDTTTETYDAAGTLTNKTVLHADKSYEVYANGVTGRDYTSAHTSYDSAGKVVLLEQFRADGSLLMKKVVGIDTTTETYDAAGTLTNKTVQHADKSYEVYANGVTGRDYTSAHTSYDSAGKVVLLEQFRADGSLLMKKVVGIDTTTETYDAAGTLTNKTVQHADKSYEVYANGVTGRDYTSAHTSYDSAGKVVLLEQFRADGSLLMKKVVGIDTTTETYDAAGTLTNKTVLHADKSYEVYANGVTGRDYVAYHEKYGTDAKNLYLDVTKADGSHMVTVNGSNVAFKVDGHADSISLKGQSDTLVFEKAFGGSAVTGFDAGTGVGHDVIDLNATLASNFAQLKGMMQTTGHDTLITFSPADHILLKGVVAESLTASNFAFHYDLH